MAVLVSTAVAFTPAVVLGQNASADTLPTLIVTATPLPAFGLDPKTIAAPVQSISRAALERSQPTNFAEVMNRNLGSVHINDMQGSLFEPDVNFRGYAASPLLGTPQGLSVYMDGVRLNQPFGDVVSWDLIPLNALQSVTLLSGSNPIFGLNSLGGALTLKTKDGRSNPGTTIKGLYGAYERMSAEAEHGGTAGALDWFVAGTAFRENSWRDILPSKVRQVFGKLGWQPDASRVAMTLAHADNDLASTGLHEQRLLAADYTSVYTLPDQTFNRATFLNLEGQHAFSESGLLSANAYYRRINTRTVNGDINELSLDQAIYQPNAAEQAALGAAGYRGFPASGATAANTPFPSWRCIANVLLRDEPAELCNGLLNRTGSGQDNYGIAAQFSQAGRFAGAAHSLTIGGAFDASHVGFSQLSELGYLDPSRSVIGVGAYADGVTGGDLDGAPFDTQVQLSSRVATASVYAMDQVALLNDKMHVTLSGRYNRTVVHNRDRIHPVGAPDSLTGDHTFSRFNPAAGVTYAPSTRITVYAGYSEASRAPSAIELGCANPEQPCKLPNAFAGDPPLSQVVAHNWEAGLRGAVNGTANLTWSAGLFRSTSSNDILFVAGNAAGFGYFKNFGMTRRQGAEFSADGTYGALSFGADYTLLEATFRSPETVGGAGNSTNDAALAGSPGLDGDIDITPGDHIPLVPRHMLKFRADLEVATGLMLGLETLTVSGSFARGNENNLHQPDGLIYLGPGKSKGYTLVALRAQYQVGGGLQLFLRADNVFDKKYATAAQLGSTAFDAAGNFLARPFPAVNGAFPLQQATFFAAGAPRMISGGIAVKF